MKEKTFLSPFFGGLIGIILAGTAYYITGSHYPSLLPLGVFIGSFIGYAIENFKTIWVRVGTSVSMKWNWFGKQFTVLSSINIPTRKCLVEVCQTCIVAKKQVTFFCKKCESLFRTIYENISKWISAHPMNKVAVIEVILASFHFGVMFLLVLHFNIMHLWLFLDDDLYTMSKLGALVGYGLSMFYPLIRKFGIRDESMKLFYQDYEFYTKYGTGLYILRGTFRNSISSCIVIVFFTIYWTVAFCFLAISAMIMIMFMVLALIREAFVVYVHTLCANAGITVFITTLVITAISYLIFYTYFIDPVVLSIVAFGTGTLCAGTVHLLRVVTEGTVFQSLLFSEDEKLEKKLWKPFRKFFIWLDNTTIQPLLERIQFVFAI